MPGAVSMDPSNTSARRSYGNETYDEDYDESILAEKDQEAPYHYRSSSMSYSKNSFSQPYAQDAENQGVSAVQRAKFQYEMALKKDSSKNGMSYTRESNSTFGSHGTKSTTSNTTTSKSAGRSHERQYSNENIYRSQKSIVSQASAPLAPSEDSEEDEPQPQHQRTRQSHPSRQGNPAYSEESARHSTSGSRSFDEKENRHYNFGKKHESKNLEQKSSKRRNEESCPRKKGSDSFEGKSHRKAHQSTSRDGNLDISRTMSYESNMGGDGYRTRTSGLTGREIALSYDAKQRSSLRFDQEDASYNSNTQSIALLGGSGMTGSRFLHSALDAGYEVRCMPSDDPRETYSKTKPWKILQAEMEDTQQLERLISGASFVVLMVNDLLPKKSGEYPAHFLTRLVGKLYALMKKQESIQLFLFQSTSLSSNVMGRTPVLSNVVKKTARRGDNFTRDLDDAMKKIAIEHCLRPIKEKIKSDDKTKVPEQINPDPPEFAFLVTRPTVLLQNGPGCKRLFASKSVSALFSVLEYSERSNVLISLLFYLFLIILSNLDQFRFLMLISQSSR